MTELTNAQRGVYEFVVAYQRVHGAPPTRGEICENFGWSSLNAADQHLKLIAKKGWLRIVGRKRSRGIEICHRPAGLGRNESPVKEPQPNTLEG